MIDTKWEAAELAGILTTYIAGIEDVLKDPIRGAVATLAESVDAVYATLAPIVGAALAEADVNLPGEVWDGDA